MVIIGTFLDLKCGCMKYWYSSLEKQTEAPAWSSAMYCCGRGQQQNRFPCQSKCTLYLEDVHIFPLMSDNRFNSNQKQLNLSKATRCHWKEFVVHCWLDLQQMLNQTNDSIKNWQSMSDVIHRFPKHCSEAENMLHWPPGAIRCTSSSANLKIDTWANTLTMDQYLRHLE